MSVPQRMEAWIRVRRTLAALIDQSWKGERGFSNLRRLDEFLTLLGEANTFARGAFFPWRFELGAAARPEKC